MPWARAQSHGTSRPAQPTQLIQAGYFRRATEIAMPLDSGIEDDDLLARRES